jgi:hypothetical protein
MRVVILNGALWGSGDMSMESFPGPGDEDGRGGVVTHSILSSVFFSLAAPEQSSYPAH